jgi:alkaline phosphatase
VNGEPVTHLMEVAEDMGKATGVVSSVEWSHATPAGFVAHNVSRNNYAEIAQEMVYDSATDGDFKYVGGQTTWDDLRAGTAGGDADGDGVNDPWYLVQDRAAFQMLMEGPTPERVLGTAQVRWTLQQGRSGDKYADPYVVPLTETVPTLEEMTKGALNVLDEDEDGFVLMVEGGAVDWAGHGNQSGRVIEEEIDFNRSVEAVCDWVQQNSNWGETLVVVTGDHETGYLTGPGSNPDWNPLVNNGAGNLPGMEWHSGSHTNQVIPFFAKGSGANFFRHVADETDPVHGRYLDNAEMAAGLFNALQ